ncbi:MAG: iron donor protein CyaY [Sandaracinaceae bacterium]
MELDEKSYQRLASDTFAEILEAFDDVDSDDADLDTAGDVISIRFRDGTRAVINTQRPARQIWLAGGDRAWHFDWDENRRAWLDDKGSGTELLVAIADLARRSAGLELRFRRRERRG